MFYRLVLTLLLVPSLSFAYTVVRKDGRMFSGDLVREDAQTILIEDERGITVKFRKDQLNLEKTQSTNAREAEKAKQVEEKKKQAEPVPATKEIRSNIQSQSEWSGEVISVDFKDIDIRDFFRFIAEISGANMILDPAVKGSLTLKLTEVPWDQALDLVCRQYGLAYEINGNVYNVK